jgi:hypothetical protein
MVACAPCDMLTHLCRCTLAAACQRCWLARPIQLGHHKQLSKFVRAGALCVPPLLLHTHIIHTAEPRQAQVTWSFMSRLLPCAHILRCFCILTSPTHLNPARPMRPWHHVRLPRQERLRHRRHDRQQGPGTRVRRCTQGEQCWLSTCSTVITHCYNCNMTIDHLDC